MSKERIACKTPTEGKSGVTNIPKWKYDLLREKILEILSKAGSDGVGFSSLSNLVGEQLSDAEKTELGSIGWHTTTVKLNMEVEGEIKRLAVKGPQRITQT